MRLARYVPRDPRPGCPAPWRFRRNRARRRAPSCHRRIGARRARHCADTDRSVPRRPACQGAACAGPDSAAPPGRSPRATPRSPAPVTAETQACGGHARRLRPVDPRAPSAAAHSSKSILLNTVSSRISPAPMPAQHLAHLARCARCAGDRSHPRRAATDPHRALPARSSETPRSARAAIARTNPTVSASTTSPTPDNFTRLTVGSRVANSWSATYVSLPVRRIEQRRFAGVGVADQRDGGNRHLAPYVPAGVALASRASRACRARCGCAWRSGAGRSPAASRRDLADRCRLSAARGGSSRAPGGSPDAKAARARPAACPRSCARAGQRCLESIRYDPKLDDPVSFSRLRSWLGLSVLIDQHDLGVRAPPHGADFLRLARARRSTWDRAAARVASTSPTRMAPAEAASALNSAVSWGSTACPIPTPTNSARSPPRGRSNNCRAPTAHSTILHSTMAGSVTSPSSPVGRRTLRAGTTVEMACL